MPSSQPHQPFNRNPVRQNEPIDTGHPPLYQQPTIPSQKRQILTNEVLYIWGFRLIYLAILASFLFVIAIYYGVINP